MALARVGLESEKAAPLAYWRAPLQWTSTLLYLLALAGATLAGLAGDFRLPGLLALLCVALFPVARPWPNASAWRGLGLPLLLSGLVWSVVTRGGFQSGEMIFWLPSAGVTRSGSPAIWLLPRWNTFAGRTGR